MPLSRSFADKHKATVGPFFVTHPTRNIEKLLECCNERDRIQPSLSVAMFPFTPTWRRNDAYGEALRFDLQEGGPPRLRKSLHWLSRDPSDTRGLSMMLGSLTSSMSSADNFFR